MLTIIGSRSPQEEYQRVSIAVVAILRNYGTAGPEVIKVFMLNSAEHKILTALVYFEVA